MNAKKYVITIVLSLVHFLVCILVGALGWDWQTVIVSAASAIAIYCSYNFIAKKTILSIAIVAPFYLFYVPLSVFWAKNLLTFPVWILGLLVCALSLVFIKRHISLLIQAFTIITILLSEYIFIYPNYFSYWYMKALEQYEYDFSAIKILDGNNNEVEKNTLKDKIILFDVWSASCGACIEAFPKLQSLYNDYKSDTTVRIISLNVPVTSMSSKKHLNPQKFTASYSFEKLYLNEDDRKKLNIEALPVVLILDKDMKCRYAGDLNVEWNIFIGNAKTIIKRLRAEL